MSVTVCPECLIFLSQMQLTCSIRGRVGGSISPRCQPSSHVSAEDRGRTHDGLHHKTHHPIHRLKIMAQLQSIHILSSQQQIGHNATNIFNAKARSHMSNSCLFYSLSTVGCAGLTRSIFNNSICTQVFMRSTLPNNTSAGICFSDSRWC